MSNKQGTAAVTLISHASVLIEVDGVRILTDPWQSGTAFNDSWRLLAPAADLEPLLDGIDYLWISHEHPDHFHIPTLRSLPDSFKQRVTVLFQRSSDHQKMVKALTGMLGFPNVRLLDHREWTRLENGVDVYCYQSRQLDSALAVRGSDATILNINDCEMSEGDLDRLKGDVGEVDVLLNQFSLAGSDGIEDALRGVAAQILDNVVRDHRALDAKTTIPFASLVYFCCPDNAWINRYANTPGRVAKRFEEEGLDLTVLMPGDRYEVGSAHDSGSALARWEQIYAGLDTLPLDEPEKVDFETLEAAFRKQRAKLLDLHGTLPLRFLKPVVIEIPDLGRKVEFSLGNEGLPEARGPADLEIHSQPLQFMLSTPFGLQTLGVSGRYRLRRNLKNWFRYRTLFALMNAGIGLSPKRMLSREQLGFFWRRRAGLMDQVRYRIQRVFQVRERSA